MILLFLDDQRNPLDTAYPTEFKKYVKYGETRTVRNLEEFQEYIKNNPRPDAVSFDYELGYRFNEEKQDVEQRANGLTVAHWYIKYCIENGIEYPVFNCHSGSTLGKQLIEEYLHVPYLNKLREKAKNAQLGRNQPDS